MNFSFDIHTADDAAHASTLLTQIAQAMRQETQGTAPAAPVPAAAAPAPAAMSQADFGAAVQAYARAHGPRAAKALLAQHGYAKTADVPAERYAELAALMAV